MTLDPRENPLLNKQQPQAPGYYPMPGIPAPIHPAIPAATTPDPAATHAAPDPATPVPVTDAPVMPPAAGIASAKAPPEKKKQKSNTSGTLDTIEAVIIALILALTFRAFVVEAFVIPTGSMAPTLLGAHFDVICPKCGYAYKESADVSWRFFDAAQLAPGGPADHEVLVNVNHGELVDSTAVPAPRDRYCPNCGFMIPTEALSGAPKERTVANDALPGARLFPWANNGDRILVLKYLYDFLEPQRWDVIVFKEPMFGQDNYIKRLIGRPGETVEIVDGDIFIADKGTDQAIRPIARKPKWVQDTVWQLVYDNDHYPTDAGDPRTKLDDRAAKVPWKWTTPWHGAGATAAAWSLDGSLMKYTGTGTGQLNFVPNDDMTFTYLRNMIGYNAVPDWYRQAGGLPTPQPGTVYVVKDLHVEMSWKPEAGDGASLSLVLGHPSSQYRFTWSGSPKLERWDEKSKAFTDTHASLVSDPGSPKAGHWYKVEMDNADHAGHVYIDGALVMQDEPKWTAAEAEARASEPGFGLQAPQIQVNVGGASQITHLKLMHDVYYSQDDRNGPAFGGIKSPANLGADEFFAMGDNSPYSHDGRYWRELHPSLQDKVRPGIVPRRFLLGRAFFVYWPAGFRPMNGAASDSARTLDVPLVPNTAEMRVIR